MNYNWDWGVFFKSTGVGSATYLDWYISGLGWTIAIAVVAWIIALLLGSILGVMRTVPNRLVSGIATCYVELFRNVPLLVQLFIWYFLIPDMLPQNLQDWYKQDLNPTTSAYLSVVVCLGLFTAARVCEQVRTGIQALPRGQEAAARAMGFKLPQIYWNVLLPQAYRIIIEEIPPAVPVDKAEAGTTAAIRLQMRYSVPLFVYGEGLWGRPDPNGERNEQGVGKPQLTWQPVMVQGKPYIELRNTGPVHARLTDVVVQQGNQAKPVAEGLLGYVLPGASMRWPAPLTVGAGGVLKGRVNGQGEATVISQGR